MASKYASRKPFIVLLCCVIISGVVAIEELEITHPPRDVYALKDAPLLLDCATSGQRVITVIWQRDGQEINLDGSRSMLANGSLLIDNVLPKKDAGIYQCCASNVFGTICSANVTITIAILPRFDVHPEPVTVAEGGTARFFCHTQAVPSPTITWKQDKKTLDPTIDTRATILPGGILQIINVSLADAGEYRCIAVNIAQKRRSQSAALVVGPRVDGQNNDIPHIVSGPTDVTTVVGESAVFECLVDWDESVAVSWSRQGGRAIQTQGVSYLGRQNLLFNSVTTSDAGVYVCTATNSITGAQVEAVAQLTVHVPPTIVVSPEPRSGPVAINARFSCAAEGAPSPRIHWLHNGRPVVRTGRYLPQPNDDLLISGTTAPDDGIIQCVAENDAGIAMASAKLTVISRTTVISPPTNVRCIAAESTSLFVTWNPPTSSEDEIIAYSVHYEPEDGSGIEIQQPVDRTTFSFKIEELEPFTSYKYYVQGWTSGGPTLPSEKEVVQTKPAPPVRWPVFMLSSTSSDTITIQWQPLPERERNGIVTMYKIICNINGGTPATERTWEVNGAFTEYTITKLEGDTLYKVAMAAKTMEYGPLSDWVSVRTWKEENTGNQTSQTPLAPYMELNTPDATSIRVNLGPPNTDVILGYKVYYKIEKPEVTKESEPAVLPVMVTEHTFAELEVATRYEVRALAYNRYGDGHSVVQAITTPRPAVTMPPSIYVPPPEIVNLTSLSPRMIRVRWAKPNTHQLIRFYTIRYWLRSNQSTAMERIVNPGNGTTSIDINNLLPFSKYELQIRSHSSKATGPYSEIWTSCTLEDRPSSPPSSVAAEPRDAHTIVVRWEPPNQPNGIINRFVIMYNMDLNIDDFSWMQEERNGTARSANVEGLNSATKYYFKVRAGTQAGEGPPTNVIEAETLELTLPGPGSKNTREHGILIGIGLALGCIICCSVFIICKRRSLCSQNYSPHTVVSQPVNGNGPPLRYSVNGGKAKVYMANSNGEDPDSSFAPMLSHLPEPTNLDTKGGSPLIINGDGPVHNPFIRNGILPRAHCHGSPMLDLEDGGSTSLSSTDPDSSGTALLSAEVKHQRSQELHASGTEIPMSSLDNAATNTQDLSCHGNSSCCSSGNHGNTSLNQELPHNLSTSPLLSTASSHNTGVHSNIGEAANRSCDRVPSHNLPQPQNGCPVTTSGVDISSDTGGQPPPPKATHHHLVAELAPQSKDPVRLKHMTGRITPHQSPSNTNHDTMVPSSPQEDIWERRCTVTTTTPDPRSPVSTTSETSSPLSPTTTSATTTTTTDPPSWVRDDNGPRYSPSSTCNDVIPDYLQRRATENTTGRGAKTCTV